MTLILLVVCRYLVCRYLVRSYSVIVISVDLSTSHLSPRTTLALRAMMIQQ